MCLLSCEPPLSRLNPEEASIQHLSCLEGSYLESNNSQKASKHDAVFHHCAKGDLGETALKVQRFGMGQSLRVVNPCSASFIGMMWGRTSW